MPRSVFAVAAIAAALCSAAAGAEDRHAGYYYPEPQTREDYISRAKTQPEADRRARIEFTNSVNHMLSARPYPPPFAVFAKGDEAEKLIVVSVSAGYANTLYRMRALMALLTSAVRQSEFFRANKVDDYFVFYDQLKLLGFRQLTFSDGEHFAHQVAIK